MVKSRVFIQQLDDDLEMSIASVSCTDIDKEAVILSFKQNPYCAANVNNKSKAVLLVNRH